MGHVTQIGKCRNCLKAIISRTGQWVHSKSNAVHCSDSLRSHVAEPARCENEAGVR